jgi:hypothetical protein
MSGGRNLGDVNALLARRGRGLRWSAFGAVCVLVFSCAKSPDAADLESNETAPGHDSALESTARAVPTFESIGLYWRPTAEPKDLGCQARYRRRGVTTWKTALPLWYDRRQHECRGSLVHLESGTTYEIELTLPGADDRVVISTETWAETVPVARVVYLPERSDEPIVIRESGTPEGYVLYTHEPGRATLIDAGGEYQNNVVISGSYVILRGLVLKHAGRDAILLEGDVHDVLIEDNDISGWGRVHADGWGMDRDAAIAAPKSERGKAERIIIQHNRIHHPRSDSNAWNEYREHKATYHPLGPQAVFFWDTRGNHVIRFNEIYSDPDHKFNDCIGGGNNFSTLGFPNRDSDIYGNRISACWDDAIEAEGANANVRIWGNYLDDTYVGVAVAPTSHGPIYVWRNIGDRSRRFSDLNSHESKGGAFLKTQSKTNRYNGKFYGDGRIYVFHNTLIQRSGEDGDKLGFAQGISDMGGGRMTNLVSRNNILHVRASYRKSINDSRRDTSNDFDHDLYNGTIIAAEDQEPDGVRGVPVYLETEFRPNWVLSPTGPGFDSAMPLPGFNDHYTGQGAELGAQETGFPLLEFGIAANRARFRYMTDPSIASD